MGPGWLCEGDAEPERPDPTQDVSASFSKKCKRVVTLGDIEGLFVIRKMHVMSLAGGKRRAKGCRKTRDRQSCARRREQAGLQCPSIIAACTRAPAFAALMRLGRAWARLCLCSATCTCTHYFLRDTVGEFSSPSAYLHPPKSRS